MGFNASGSWSGWFSAALIAIFLLVVFSEARLKSPAYDEPPHIGAGLSYFVTHEIFRANPQHPPLLKELSALSMMAAGIHWPRTADADYLVNGDDPARVLGLDWLVGNDIIRTNGPDRVLVWARLPMMLVAALLAAVLYLWGRQLFGPLAAAGAVFVFVLDPTILAHSQLVTTDVGVAGFTVLALFALWAYLRRPGWTRLLLCGLSLGAALAAKYSAVLLLPVYGLLLLAAIRWPLAFGTEGSPSAPAAVEARVAQRKGLCPCGSGRRYKNCHGRSPSGASTKSDFSRKLAFAAGAFAIMCLVAFAFVQATFFFPRDLMMYVRCSRMVYIDHDPTYLAYLAGDMRLHFTNYFLVAYGLKEPLAGIILALIGLVALIRSKSIPFLGKLFLLVPPVVFFAVVTVMADDLGVRYIIPALPFAHLIAGLGIAAILQAARKFRWAPYAAASLCAWAVLAAAGIYPDHLSYFNEAACLLTQPGQIGLDGGSRCGPAWLDDSNVDWGQGLKQLKTWLGRNAAGRQVKLAMSFSFPPEAYGINCQRLKVDDLVREPGPGLYAVSAHLVARIPALSGASDWLQRMQPVAIVGHALYIYDIPSL
jgi:hypothetical protein